jgi:hypothetical protein
MLAEAASMKTFFDGRWNKILFGQHKALRSRSL